MNFRSKKLFLNLLFICGIIFLIGCVIHFYIHFKQTDHIFFITMAGVGTLLFMSSLVLLKKYNAPKKVIENKSNESEKFLKMYIYGHEAYHDCQ